MKAVLIQATPSPVNLITGTASICYGKTEAAYPDRLLRNLYKGGHHSVFEHVYYTFYIEGISRACLAQLTRHRHASFTVRSQRYCDESEQTYVMPDVSDSAKGVISSTMEIINSSYMNLIKSGVKREDARSILPQATSTDLYVSMNLRELMHIHALRTYSAAQEEISELLTLIVDLVLRDEPDLELLFRKDE